MSKFKVGDRVRMVSNSHSRINKGALGVVSEDDGDDCPLVRWDGDGDWYTSDEKMEPVESGLPTDAPLTHTSSVIDAATAYREALARHQETAAEVEAARERLLTLAGAAA